MGINSGFLVFMNGVNWGISHDPRYLLDFSTHTSMNGKV